MNVNEQYVQGILTMFMEIEEEHKLYILSRKYASIINLESLNSRNYKNLPKIKENS